MDGGTDTRVDAIFVVTAGAVWDAVVAAAMYAVLGDVATVEGAAIAARAVVRAAGRVETGNEAAAGAPVSERMGASA